MRAINRRQKAPPASVASPVRFERAPVSDTALREHRRLPIATRHASADFDAMTATVGEGAKWAVEEGNTASPTFRLRGPFSPPDIEPSIRFEERSVSDTGQGVERTREGRPSC